jgi:branched-chain amino acid transport system permease protein
LEDSVSVLPEVFQVLTGGVKSGAIYSLSAMGLVVIHKATKTVNFAHGAFIMLGAYAAYFGLLALPYWAVYLLAPIAVGLCAVGIEAGVLRTLRRADHFSVVISTVFLGIAIMEFVRFAYESEMLTVPSVLVGPSWNIGGVVITRETMWIGVGALTASAAALYVFMNLSIGRGMRAMASNPRGAQLCGYSVDWIYGVAWFFGGALAGLAGLFAAPPMGVDPELALATLVPAFVAAVIGGFNSLLGALLGGVILGIAEAVSAAYVSSAMKGAVTFLLLFAVLVFRPGGLFPDAAHRHA